MIDPLSIEAARRADVIADCEARLSELDLLTPHLPRRMVVERFLALISPSLPETVATTNIQRVLLQLAEDREATDCDHLPVESGVPEAVKESPKPLSEEIECEPLPPEENAPPEKPAETESGKVCAACDRYRTRAQFRQHGPAKDGLRKLCIECEDRNRPKPKDVEPEEAKEGAYTAKPSSVEKVEEKPAPVGKVTLLPPAGKAPMPEPRKSEAKKSARRCENGEDCVAVAQTGFPTKLTSRNPDRTCFACQEENSRLIRLGVGGMRKAG